MNLGLGILLSAVHATTFIAEQKFEVVQFLLNQTLDEHHYKQQQVVVVDNSTTDYQFFSLQTL